MTTLSTRPIIWTALLSVVALIGGLASVVFGSFASVKPTLFLVPPIILLVILTFLINKTLFFYALLFIRVAADGVLEQMKGNEGGLGVGALLNIGILAYGLSLLIESAQRNSRLRASVSLSVAMWAPFILIALLSMFRAPEQMTGLKAFLPLLCSATMFMAGVCLTKDEQRRRFFYRLVVAAMLIPFIVSVGMLGAGIGYASHADEGFRLNGAFGHPNILAFFCALAFTIVLYDWKFITDGKIGWTLICSLTIVLSVVLLVATKTRSAWAAVFFVSMIYGVVFDRKVLIALAISAVGAFFIPEVRDRIAEIGETKYFSYGQTSNSYEWRMMLWQSGLSWLSPVELIFGKGMSSFYTYSREFFALANGVSWGAHSVYVQLIFETGIIGALAFLYLFARIAYASRPQNGIPRRTALSILTLSLAYLCIAYSDNMLNYSAFNYYYFFIIGTALGPTVARATQNINKNQDGTH